ncbi:hypothetical protein [Ilumatobacter nonamiensis]|nr:hypothetical protein [Ilumatobacter nonamiensis]
MLDRTTDSLESFSVPKRDEEVTIEHLHGSGRGTEYTASPFAYLFRRVR